MEVNFDNLRTTIAHLYNDIVGKVNACKLDYQTTGTVNNETILGDTLLYQEDLRETLDDMRDTIGTLLACYNNDDVNDVSDEVELAILNGGD